MPRWACIVSAHPLTPRDVFVLLWTPPWTQAGVLTDRPRWLAKLRRTRRGVGPSENRGGGAAAATAAGAGKGGGSPNDGASIGCSGEQSPATPAWSRERFAWSAAGTGASQALACSDQGDQSWMRGALGLQPAARLA